MFEKLVCWLVAVAAAVGWLYLYQYASDNPINQGMVILVSIFCALTAVKCKCKEKEAANV